VSSLVLQSRSPARSARSFCCITVVLLLYSNRLASLSKSYCYLYFPTAQHDKLVTLRDGFSRQYRFCVLQFLGSLPLDDVILSYFNTDICRLVREFIVVRTSQSVLVKI